MANIIKTGQVIYVEPNEISDFTSYNTTNNGTVAKSVDLEDLSISVDLKVEIKGRTYMSSKNGNQENITLSWQSSAAKGESLSFFQGSQIPTVNGKVINSLTTNYTDCHLVDIKKDGTAEMFGIKTIDISYNNFMIPEVNIQFTDVRGVSLFAQEEMRHNAVRDGITGSVNNDIEGSFFKCFFTFPYPKFILTVKGFYGEKVSYELTCSDFRSAFDANTGNFNVNAKFIGYNFSFLGDVMVNALTAAPYCEYQGKDYWKKNVEEKRFFVWDKDGKPTEMITLGEIVENYKHIEDAASKAASEEATKEEGSENNSSTKATTTDTSESINKGKTKESLLSLKNTYDDLMKRLKKLAKNYNKQYSYDVAIRPTGTNSYAFITDYDPGDIKTLIGLFDDFREKINSCDGLNKWKEDPVHKFELKKWDDYGSIVDKDTKKINTKCVPEQALADAINKKSKEIYSHDNTKMTYEDGWKSWDDSTVCIYQDFGLKKIFAEAANAQGADEQVAEQKLEQIEERALCEAFEKEFNFYPTVENITRVIMAHMETLVHVISECVNNILNQGTQRSVENLGVKFGKIADAGPNTVIGLTKDTIVPPFPKIVETVDMDGAKKDENAWIGKVITKNGQTEEAKLIDALLNAVATFNTHIDAALTPSDSEDDGSANGIKYPLTYFDLFSDKTENIFGDISFKDVNSIFANICVRAFSVMVTQNSSLPINASLYGKMDAENFLDVYNVNGKLNQLANQIENITSEKVIDYLTTGEKAKMIDPSKKNNPWWNYTHLVDKVESKVKLVAGHLGQEQAIFPIKNWSLHEMSKKAHQHNDAPTNGLLSPALDNYILTPLTQNDDKNTSTLLIIKENPISYLKNKSSEIFGSEYETNNKAASNIFKDSNKFDFTLPDDITKNRYSTFRTAEGEPLKPQEALSYDSEGNLTITSGTCLALGDVFASPEMYSETSTPRERAHALIDSVSFGYVLNKIYLHPASFVYVTKCTLIRNGVYIEENQMPHVRPAIANKVKKYSDDWIDGFYKQIESKYVLQFKQADGYSKMIGEINSSDKEDTTIRIIVHKHLKDEYWSTFLSLYEIKGFNTQSQRLNLFAKPCAEMNNIIENLMSVVGVCATSRFTMSHSSYTGDISIKESDLKNYLDGFIGVLQDKLEATETENQSVEIELNTDPDDIKIGLYNYIKLLYDKWLASGIQNDFYKAEELFDGPNPTFHFLDSAYNRVGKSMYLNLGKFVDKLIYSQTSEEYTLLSLLSTLYSENRFLFLCVQNFMDLSKPEMMSSMFKPIPYYKAAEPDNHPNFVVLMPYEPSSKLDVEGADYPDDGIYLNDENTWPEMIKSKPENSLPIPSFAVSYGQQYQNYFTNIQVDMSSPMTTEQSIKAKCLIAGVNSGKDNNPTRAFTVGQDLYTIYSNNSYTCTVTMMGCAWVQPMMYFVLHNIPMFRGSYMIIKVNHQLQAGNMITTFKGVRMANTATRSVQTPIVGLTVDSHSGAGEYGSDGRQLTGTAYADIANDCDYAYYDPLQRQINLPSDAAQEEYCYAVYTRLRQGANLSEAQAKGVCANFFGESRLNPYMVTIDWGTGWHGAGGGLASFLCALDENDRPRGEGGGLFQYVYGSGTYISELKKLNTETEKFYKTFGVNKPIPALRFPISFEKQMEYMCNVINTRGDVWINRNGHKKKFNFQDLKNKKTPNEAADFFELVFEKPAKLEKRWDLYGKQVESAISKQSKLQQNKNNTDDNVSIEQIASGLTLSIQNSLHSTQRYNQVTVKEKKLADSGGNVYKYEIENGLSSDNNAIFDCLLSQYGDWFTKIEWYVGTAQSKSDAKSVIVHLTKTAPKSHDIVLTGRVGDARKPMKISQKEHISESLRLILTKYFKSKNITTASAAKSTFKSCNTMSDETTQSTFELSGGNSIINCNSLMGSGPYGSCAYGAPIDMSYQVTNPKMKKVLSDVGHYMVTDKKCATLTRDGHSECTKGPRTWYGKAGVNIGGIWWTGESSAKGCFNDAKRVLGGAGFVCVWHGNKNTPLPTLHPGDISVIFGYKKRTIPSSHGAMWTGKDWRSDYIQPSMFVYSKGRAGDKSASIWRHPDFQEPGQEVIPVA